MDLYCLPRGNQVDGLPRATSTDPPAASWPAGRLQNYSKIWGASSCCSAISTVRVFWVVISLGASSCSSTISTVHVFWAVIHLGASSCCSTISTVRVFWTVISLGASSYCSTIITTISTVRVFLGGDLPGRFLV